MQTTAVPALVIRRTYDADPRRIYEAWTTPALARRFLCPDGVAVADVTMDVRPGGAFRIAMERPDGERYVAYGTYREVVPATRLQMLWHWEEDDPKDVVESLLTLEFAPHGSGTELTLTHEHLRDLDSLENHRKGWTSMLAKMDVVRGFAITGLDVSGYMVKDAPRAIAFYREVLGLEPTRVYSDDRGAEYDFGPETFCLWGGGGKSGIPFQPSNGVLFGVDSFDAARAALAAQQIPVVFEMESDNCRMAGISDSEGNLVVLHERKPKA